MSKQNKPFLVFGEPAIGEAEIAEVVSCLRSGWIGTGPRVAKFEAAFADYMNVPKEHVAAVNSCTAGLHVSMIASGIGAGDEVITTAMTFCATVNAILHAGATPVLADIDPETFNIDPESVRNAITDKTKAIVPVHFAGRACNMDELKGIAKQHNLLIIEDCAHAIETTINNRHAGTFGDFGCFSFYVTKNVVTAEGGMIITKNDNLISRAKMLSLHGLNKDAWHRFGDKGYRHYYVHEAGYKYNMTDIQASLGIHQLAKVEKNWQRRREIWDRYNEAFSEAGISSPAPVNFNTRHAFHLYTILVGKSTDQPSRDEFLNRMNRLGIGTGVHYLSIAEHPYYQQRFGWKPTSWPEAMTCGRHTVSLPLSAKLTDSDVSRVIDGVRSALA